MVSFDPIADADAPEAGRRVRSLVPNFAPGLTAPMDGTLPEPFRGWFVARGWSPRPHQLAMLDAARAGDSVLLIARTGGGKTLAGFLPSLVDLTEAPREGLH